MPEGNRARENWLRNSLNCKKGRVGKKEEKMWGKKDMTRKGSQKRTNQCKMREGQRRNTEDEGIRSRCGASHGHTAN